MKFAPRIQFKGPQKVSKMQEEMGLRKGIKQPREPTTGDSLEARLAVGEGSAQLTDLRHRVSPRQVLAFPGGNRDPILQMGNLRPCGGQWPGRPHSQTAEQPGSGSRPAVESVA